MARDPKAKSKAANPFKRKKASEAAYAMDPHVHMIKEGVRCETESRGHPTPENRSPLELVLDATEGFIPLWAKDTTLRWRFRESSLQAFEDPEAMKARIEELLREAIVRWGDAAPVKFAKSTDAWDFEIVVRENDNCNATGCVLASAFFPDAGRHELRVYPKMFEQEIEEQIETFIHEIGHSFGLRHFFALVKETGFPAQLFGSQDKFTIMNYGADSKLTQADRDDLKRLYDTAWSGQLTQINGTPIKIVTPFHTLGQ